MYLGPAQTLTARFSDGFRGRKRGALGKNGLRITFAHICDKFSGSFKIYFKVYEDDNTLAHILRL